MRAYQREILCLRDWDQDLYESFLASIVSPSSRGISTTKVISSLSEKILASRLVKENRIAQLSFELNSEEIGNLLRLLCKTDKNVSPPRVYFLVRLLFEWRLEAFVTSLINQKATLLYFRDFCRKRKSVLGQPPFEEIISLRIRGNHYHTARLRNLQLAELGSKISMCIDVFLPNSMSSWVLNIGSYHSITDKKPSIDFRDKNLTEIFFQILQYQSSTVLSDDFHSRQGLTTCWQRLHKITVQGRVLTPTAIQRLVGYLESSPCYIRSLTLVWTDIEEVMVQALRKNDSVEELKLCTELRQNIYSRLVDMLEDVLSCGMCSLTSVWLGNASHTIDLSNTTLPYWCSLNRAGRAKLRRRGATVKDLVDNLPSDCEVPTLYGLLRDNPSLWSNV